MDETVDGLSPDDLALLSYDETTAYEEQVAAPASLAARIGSTKIYLLSESSVPRAGKRKHGEDGDVAAPDEDEVMADDPTLRSNALLLHGTPIAHLPTARIFAYATHFDAHPLGLEWVDDTTCVLVFDAAGPARTAFRHLQKAAADEPDAEGYVVAHPIPVALWPPKERIDSSLGMSEGLKGVVGLRWARVDDVKKKGAIKESEFYKKHGVTAGKEIYPERGEGPQKRARRGEEDEAIQKAQLDDDLDEFLAADEPTVPASPPSKMRSDYIAHDGRTLLERTSDMRAIDDTLASRITAPLPRRVRESTRRGRRENGAENGRSGRRDTGREWDRDPPRRSRTEKGRERRGGTERPRKSQQELDDELEAFLNEKD